MAMVWLRLLDWIGAWAADYAGLHRPWFGLGSVSVPGHPLRISSRAAAISSHLYAIKLTVFTAQTVKKKQTTDITDILSVHGVAYLLLTLKLKFKDPFSKISASALQEGKKPCPRGDATGTTSVDISKIVMEGIL